MARKRLDGYLRGEMLDDHVPDALLIAEAATRDLAAVTRNAGEFRNTGGKIVNPWAAKLR